MNKDFRVIGYYAGWNGMQPDKLDFSVLTNLIYAFAIPTPDGHLRPLEYPEVAKELIKRAHDNGKRISLAVGGWSYLDIPLEATFVQATDSPEKIESLGDEIIQMCQDYGFDGIDMDWEHPRYQSGTYKQYEALMLYLSEKLHGAGKLLTSAVLSGVTWDGEVYEDSASHTDKVLEAVDWLNVMTYDGGEGIHHSTYEFAVNCMNYWLKDRGLKREKVMMGLPFYSYMPPMSYAKILAADPEAYAKDMIQTDGKEFHYNGMDTMARKVRHACENCGGVMIWEVTEDTQQKEYSLLQTIGKVIIDFSQEKYNN